MKITYEFCNGEQDTVEVSEELGEFLMESRRLEENMERRERYHCEFSLDGSEYEGDSFAELREPLDEILRRELREDLIELLDLLTDVQRRRLLMFAAGMTVREIANAEESSHVAVVKSIKQAREIILKNL